MTPNLIFVVQSFSRGARDELLVDQPALAADRTLANRLARALARRKAGVVAFSARVGPDSHLVDEACIIASFGLMPARLLSASLYAERDRPASGPGACGREWLRPIAVADA